MARPSAAPPTCPCGRDRPYAACCGRIHDDLRVAERAEDVMRARYSAYVLGLPEFLRDSWHPTRRPAVVELDPSIRWSGLTVLETTGGGAIDVTGEVRFVARYVQHGRSGVLAEHSRFERLPVGWVFADAIA